MIVAAVQISVLFGCFFQFFQFLPQTGDRIIATAAADAKVQIHTVETKETSQVYKCHIGRVKRLATAPDTPYMLWSASEDGTIRYAYYVFSLAEFSNKFMIFFYFARLGLNLGLPRYKLESTACIFIVLINELS